MPHTIRWPAYSTPSALNRPRHGLAWHDFIKQESPRDLMIFRGDSGLEGFTYLHFCAVPIGVAGLTSSVRNGMRWNPALSPFKFSSECVKNSPPGIGRTRPDPWSDEISLSDPHFPVLSVGELQES